MEIGCRAYVAILQQTKRERVPCIPKFFVGQGKTKSSQNVQILIYDILHVIITFIGLKLTFGNMGCHGAPSLISEGSRKSSPPPPAFS